uniref:Uncharacterized protein n=1 Tax=Glossina morsitans morsitans TaxID=37546 RepID=A0A1B0G1Q0_GLOMM
MNIKMVFIPDEIFSELLQSYPELWGLEQGVGRVNCTVLGLTNAVDKITSEMLSRGELPVVVGDVPVGADLGEVSILQVGENVEEVSVEENVREVPVEENVREVPNIHRLREVVSKLSAHDKVVHLHFDEVFTDQTTVYSRSEDKLYGCDYVLGRKVLTTKQHRTVLVCG